MPLHQWYYRVLRTLSRWDEALEQIEKAVELDPFSQIININHAEYYDHRREYDKALELSKKAVELDPNFAGAHLQLAALYAKMKRSDDARREWKIGVDLIQGSYPKIPERMEAFIAYREGNKEGVRRLMPRLEASFGVPLGTSASEVGTYHIFLGEVDTGFEWLEKSYSRKESELLDIGSDEALEGVRNDPRYQNLLKRLGLEQPSVFAHPHS